MATTVDPSSDFPSVEAQLASGKPALLRARGKSMYPMIPDGTLVLLAPLPLAAPLKAGQVVLARSSSSLLLHRVLKVSAGKVLLKGDWNRAQDGWVARDQVLGQVAALWRNGERFPMDGLLARGAGLVISGLIPPLGRLLRLI
jgi:hypothetical protein